jgi:hypothetical protein
VPNFFVDGIPYFQKFYVSFGELKKCSPGLHAASLETDDPHPALGTIEYEISGEREYLPVGKSIFEYRPVTPEHIMEFLPFVLCELVVKYACDTDLSTVEIYVPRDRHRV